jgi:hypothetical protein
LARTLIEHYQDRFPDFDVAIFPLQAAAGIVGELDPILVHRISPRDATGLVDPAVRPKVAGERLGHFGGFLDRRWRSNDIMWGRLDTAERLVKCLTPAGSDAHAMLEEAHDAILRAEWYTEQGGGAARLGDPRAEADTAEARRWRIETFRGDFRPPPLPDKAELLSVASRASQVTSDMLEGVAGRPGASAVHRAVAIVAWVLTALTTILFPGGVVRTPVRYLSAFIAGTGIALFFVGTVLNWHAASSTGRWLMAVGIGSLVVVLVVRLGSRTLLRAILWTLIAVVLVLAAYGGWRLWDEHGPGSDNGKRGAGGIPAATSAPAATT